MSPRKKAKLNSPEDSKESVPFNEYSLLTPTAAALETANEAIVSLTLLKGSRPSFLLSLLEQYITKYDVIKKKQDALAQMAASQEFPRSIRFKFKLTGPDDIVDDKTFKVLEKSCDDRLLACKKILKSNIIAARELHVATLNTSLSRLAIEFITVLAQTYFIAKSDYKRGDFLKAIANAMKDDSLQHLFDEIDQDKWPETVLSFILDESEFETRNADPGVTEAFKNCLVLACTNCLLDSINKYKEVIEEQKIALRLDSLGYTSQTVQSTVATTMLTESEPTLDHQTINDLIDMRLDSKMKDLRQQVKNLSRGAGHSASLNNKSRNNTAASKQSRQPILKTTPKYTNGKNHSKPNVAKKGTKPKHKQNRSGVKKADGSKHVPQNGNGNSVRFAKNTNQSKQGSNKSWKGNGTRFGK